MTEKQTNKLARKMGVILCESGMRMIRNAFELNPYIIPNFYFSYNQVTLTNF